MIVAAADGQDALINERVAESAVEAWRGRIFGLLACLWHGELVDVAVFGKGNVDEGHVHVMMGVPYVFWRALQFLRSGSEPIDLILFDPVVAPELTLVGRVAVGIEHVEGYGGVRAATACENLDVVVPNAIDVFGANMR